MRALILLTFLTLSFDGFSSARGPGPTCGEIPGCMSANGFPESTNYQYLYLLNHSNMNLNQGMYPNYYNPYTMNIYNANRMNSMPMYNFPIYTPAVNNVASGCFGY